MPGGSPWMCISSRKWFISQSPSAELEALALGSRLKASCGSRTTAPQDPKLRITGIVQADGGSPFFFLICQEVPPVSSPESFLLFSSISSHNVVGPSIMWISLLPLLSAQASPKGPNHGLWFCPAML